MSTIYSAGAILALMSFLILVVAGPMIAFRILGEHEVHSDHPRH